MGSDDSIPWRKLLTVHPAAAVDVAYSKRPQSHNQQSDTRISSAIQSCCVPVLQLQDVSINKPFKNAISQKEVML